MEEDEGTTTNVEGRVIHHRKVVTPPAEAREDWKIICDIGYVVWARVTSSATSRRRRSSMSCGSPPRVDRRITAALPGSGSTPRWECSGRVPSSITQGPHVFMKAIDLDIRTGRLIFSAVDWRPSAEDARRRISDHPDDGTCGVPVSIGHTDTSHWRAGGSIPATSLRDSPSPGRRSSASRTATSYGREPSRSDRRSREGREDDSAGHGLCPVPLASRPFGQQLHYSRDRPCFQDSGVQDLRGPRLARSMNPRTRSPR